MTALSVYLDYAATTPVDDRVIEAMILCLGRQVDFGNPASTSHLYGQRARDLVEHSRRQVAQAIGVHAEQVIWTSGATESNNLAIKGIVQRGGHIVTSLIEHKAVIDTVRQLESAGCPVTWLAPDRHGLIQPEAVQAALRPDTSLVSLMWVNNELGTLTDIASIGETVRAHGALLHVDAAQAVGKFAIDLNGLAVDLMSMSAHKAYGPKGIGALYVGERARPLLQAQIHGGGHEQGMRSGTLPTHQIVGMGSAFALAAQFMSSETLRIAGLAEQLAAGLLALPGISLNGCARQRIPHTLNVRIDRPGFDPACLSGRLAVSSTSACNSASASASHVLMALGLEPEQARASVRLSIGRYTDESDIAAAVRIIAQALQPSPAFWQSGFTAPQ